MLSMITPTLFMLMLPLLFKKFWLITGLNMYMICFFSLTFIYSPLFNPHYSNTLFMLDSLSSPLISLSIWISTLMIFCSTNVMKKSLSPMKFISTIISLMLILMMTFAASNLMLFYLLFEASLIPTLFLIMGWGYQPERIQASMYFMLYTITASLPLLINLLIMYSSTGHLFIPLSSSMNQLQPHNSLSYSLWWLMTIMAFMVKMPLYSVHLWLPKAHVEAPVAGSMILAGILLKLGSYGLIRISMFFPTLTFNLAPLMSSVALWGALITSLICIRQSDMKSLIAYSSISHMALIIAGSTFMSSWGWQGSLTLMLGHGLCSSCLFALANMTYEATNTRSIFLMKGMLSMFPIMSMWWFFMSIMNMAAPPSINLLAEITLIMSIMYISKIMMPILAMISFLAAAYSLFLYTTINHGTPSSYSNPFSLLLSNNYSMMIMHLMPLLGLISAPETIFSWT
uniref:NADH-ubiquinone oxidoreductase chain 4 n=1 Tax=Laetmonice producta TaxID=2153329 RepID=A0A343W6F1_9ANNE|nr:NADH dehydrogenase subunit 4 [Laetmonice producta]